MLGTIFGIVDSKTYSEHLDMSLPMSSENYYFADYTSRDVSIEEHIKELRDFLIRCGCASYFLIQNDNRIIFKEGFKENYFHKKFETLMQSLLTPDNFAKFCNNCQWTYDLRMCIDKEYGNYVSDEYGSWGTFDDFVRTLEYNTEYVVFDALDYK